MLSGVRSVIQWPKLLILLLFLSAVLLQNMVSGMDTFNAVPKNNKEEDVQNTTNADDSTESKKRKLQFRSDGTFKIIQFTDLHYGEWPKFNRLNTIAQKNLLDHEKPDYVMLSGDMISAYEKTFLNTSLYPEMWQMLTAPMIERNIPWSITFGNHDSEGLYTAPMLIDLDNRQSAELSLTQRCKINGVGESNYILPIMSSTDEDKVASLIYIFDSDNPGCGRLGDWGCIRPQQVEWYQQQSDRYNRVPSVAYVHVPPVEVIDLWSNFDVYGDFGDPTVCCFNTSHTRFIDAMVERQDIKGLYFGHDHKNDFHGDYHGIDLGYGRKTGYGGYDPKYPQGARVVQLQEGPPFKLTTWIRNVYGTVEEQMLHRPQQGLKLYCCVVADSNNQYSWIYFMSVLMTIMLSVLVYQFRTGDKKVYK